MYKINISKYKIKAILGILDFERLNAQRLEINFSCNYENKKEYINYMDIASFIKSSLIQNKYFLIEDSIDDICENLNKEYANMQNIYLEIKKLDALGDGYVSVATN